MAAAPGVRSVSVVGIGQLPVREAWPEGLRQLSVRALGQAMEEAVLERFDGYYGGAPDLAPVGPACVEGTTFGVIPEALTRVAALSAGEVDIIQAVPPELLDTLAQTPGIQVQTAGGSKASA